MKKILALLGIAVILTAALPSCKGKLKDADVKTSIETVLMANPDFAGLGVDVKDGVATLSGMLKDDAAKGAVEAAIKGIKGVKSVVNSTTVPPPPPLVVITADDPLTKGITDALKDFPGISATAKDGIISVTGEITSTNWKKVKMALDALSPKKVDASALKIK